MKEITAHLLISLAIASILILVSFNLHTYLSSADVLGINTENPTLRAQIFWETFLAEHPDYFPGWMELAKIDKDNGNPLKSFEDLSRAKSINPNSPALPRQ